MPDDGGVNFWNILMSNVYYCIGADFQSKNYLDFIDLENDVLFQANLSKTVLSFLRS